MREMERDIRPTAVAASTNGSDNYRKIPPAGDNGMRKQRLLNGSVSVFRPLVLPLCNTVCTGVP